MVLQLLFGIPTALSYGTRLLSRRRSSGMQMRPVICPAFALILTHTVIVPPKTAIRNPRFPREAQLARRASSLRGAYFSKPRTRCRHQPVAADHIGLSVLALHGTCIETDVVARLEVSCALAPFRSDWLTEGEPVVAKRRRRQVRRNCTRPPIAATTK